ncbi:MAG TPA: hypothetical protein DEF47_12325 [Herpetosiphon sp.]|uniref:Acetoacetate decarboxylase n=1 Tax=Herpetosiphon aurantiacus (strain ATCC 23779 / DSM 785 / 114-95) TaxID=316274 RepID=A9B4F7_HERA2|nr:acetoacetate decarboxylase family protein [Herpetosiphon sp.]ABX02714.1 hypothetical protein Haur_0062 [Herpetosiphon aurantiacus DSM 785]HBW50681.1 hypothetical protein [Herpetosiphon sp.]
MSALYDSAVEADRIAATTAYPPAPWVMQGTWVWCVHPVKRNAVADLLPAPLKPLWLPTGRTLAFSLVGQYGTGSTLHYGEAACGLILKFGPRPAIWIHGLVVDLDQSVAGGRNIWHLPKELARISWTNPNRDRISADQHGRLLLSFEGIPKRINGFNAGMNFDVLVVHQEELYRIPARFAGTVGITRKIRPFFPASGAWAKFGVSGYSISGLGHGRGDFGELIKV